MQNASATSVHQQQLHLCQLVHKISHLSAEFHVLVVWWITHRDWTLFGLGQVSGHWVDQAGHLLRHSSKYLDCNGA